MPISTARLNKADTVFQV